MEKLNKLAELAAGLGGESWGYRRTTPYSRGYITGNDGRTIVQTTSGEVPANVCQFIEMADPETVLAIAEAFRSLEQRAEAAEAKLVSVTESRDQWKANAHEFSRCADRLEAKLAEMEKQEPIAHAWDVPKYPGSDRKVTELCSPKHKDAYPVYARPVPAINLAELVPGDYPLIRLQKAKLWIDRVMMDKPGMKEAKTISAILRKIEEAG